MFMGLSSVESRSLTFCANKEQKIFQMQFVIWVLKPSVVTICLTMTSTPRTATVYEVQRDLHFIKQCVLKLVMWYETQMLRIYKFLAITFFYKPIPGTLRSKAWVCGGSLAGIGVSNPIDGTDVCLWWVLCVVR